MNTIKNIFVLLLALAAIVGCQEVEEPANTVPTVKTDAVEKVFGYYAYLSGSVSSKAYYYFLISTDESLSDAQKVESYAEYNEDRKLWVAQCEVSDLKAGTTYFAALCATDGRSEVRGNVVSFSTESHLLSFAETRDYLWNGQLNTNAFYPEAADYEIGFFTTNSTDDTSFKDINERVSLDNTGAGQSALVVDGRNPFNLYAYYPYYDEEEAADGSWTVYADGQIDWMYGAAYRGDDLQVIDETRSEATVRLRHAMGKVVLHIKGDMSFDGKQVELVSLVNVPRQGMFSVVDGIDKETFGYGTLDIKPDIRLSTAAEQVEILVIPYGVEPVSLSLQIEGVQEYTQLLTSEIWEPGRQYDYDVTLQDGQMIVGNPEEDNPAGTYEKVDLGVTFSGKKLYWAHCNLGATAPEDYGNLYGWGDPTGTHREQSEDSNDPNYVEDCLSLYGGANPPANICGTNLDIARATLGGNWRLPTVGEMYLLSGACEEEFVTINGVRGVRYTSKTNGNSIFYPEAPVRTGSSVTTGNQTFYWLGDLNDEDSSMGTTFHLDFYYSNAWPTAGEKRWKGLPVRAVCEE